MKLSLQHLKYIWEQGGENREEKTRQTVDLVVRQIDRLAETASAFADFSKMTIANRHSRNRNPFRCRCLYGICR